MVYVSQWAVGFIVVLAVVGITKMKVEGIMAWIMLTALPFGLGYFLFHLLNITN